MFLVLLDEGHAVEKDGQINTLSLHVFTTTEATSTYGSLE